MTYSTAVKAGYLSRILARFDSDGLTAGEPSAVDARRKVIRLAEPGREVFGMLDARQAQDVRELLSGLDGEQRRRLLGAMTAILEHRAGFELVDEEAHHSFGHDIVGQNWPRSL